MKKPIDPNLNNSGRDDLLGIAPAGAKPSGEPDFKVVDKAAQNEAFEGTQAPVNITENVTAESESPSGSSHHHHSSGSSHHHHSSGKKHHHSSGSSHHHSSSSSSGKKHHHSSGKKHHHSSGSSKSSSKKHRLSKRWKKLPLPAKIAVGIILAVILALIVAITAFVIFRSMGKRDVLPNTAMNTAYHETIEYKGHKYKYNNNIVALGFLGVDQRTMKTVDETDFVGAADTDIVIAIDTKTGRTKAISIPRDTMIDIDIYSPDSGVLLFSREAQLCLAYSYGDGAVKSCENTVDAMSRILYNVPIQKYYALDLDGIAPLNDAIGGVTLISQYDFPEEGIKIGDEVTLKGDMAEKYVRIRSLDSLDASINRAARQVQYIKAYASQALPAVLNSFSTVNSLYETASSYSRTNLTLSNATYIASLLLQKGIRTFDTYTIEGELKAADDVLLPDVVHLEFYPDEDSVMQTVLDVFYTQID